MAYKNKMIRNPKAHMAIRFLQTAKDTNGRFLEMEARYAAHSAEPVAHYHPHQEEDFMVLSGELTVKINGRVKILRAGEGLHIPEKTVHSMWNNSNGATIVNWKVTPAMNTENLLETTAGLAVDGKTNSKGRPPVLQVALMANKYAEVFRLSKPPYFVQKIVFTVLSPFAYLAGYQPDYKKYLD